MVDIKANQDDVFKVFDEIRRSIDIVSSKQANYESSKNFADMLNEQKILNNLYSGSNSGFNASHSSL